ncbi:hypothetical protein Q2490_15110 [Myroides odoratimimus]|uniref:hypothetical protein n=1 Tax=Myroides odoratimimus TaxID=76832 RepID=UPI0026E0644D|nr:hypothetical protein [Myroides odoratimimus]MDO5858613.1 hypothetical protein [Myroides odoratimimus]
MVEELKVESKVIVESYQKNVYDPQKKEFVNKVYLDFVDVQSYYSFLQSLSEHFEPTDTSVFGTIDCEKILSMKITDDNFNTNFFSPETKWYSGFEIIFREKPKYFRFSDGQYKLKEGSIIEKITESINNKKFEVSQDSSFIKWFTLDIDGTFITDFLEKI